MGEVAGEQDWSQPACRGRPLVLGIVVLAASTSGVLLLPMVDGLRHAVVTGVLAALVALQVPLGVRSWRAGRRPLSPRWMRMAHQTGWVWGFTSGVTYVLGISGPDGARSSVVIGALTAMVLAVFLWFADPGRGSGKGRPSLRADERADTRGAG